MRNVVEGYCRHLLMYTKQFTADTTNNFSFFIFVFLKKAQYLIRKQWDDVNLTVSRNLEAIDGFFRARDSNFIEPGWYL